MAFVSRRLHVDIGAIFDLQGRWTAWVFFNASTPAEPLARTPRKRATPDVHTHAIDAMHSITLLTDWFHQESAPCPAVLPAPPPTPPMLQVACTCAIPCAETCFCRCSVACVRSWAARPAQPGISEASSLNQILCSCVFAWYSSAMAWRCCSPRHISRLRLRLVDLSRVGCTKACYLASPLGAVMSWFAGLASCVDCTCICSRV